MRIVLTGQVRVEDGDRVLDEAALPGRQGRLVLARLALTTEPVHRDVLAETLWPSGPPSTWERTLSGVISRLRSGFSTAGFDDLSIANAFGCYELQRPVDAVLDIEIAVDETAAAERALTVGDLGGASAAASAAAAIARRPLLSGEEGEWIDVARTELRSALVRALDVQAAAAIGTSEAVAAASEAIENEPYRETSHVLLMRAHAALGNVAEALLAYERCRTLLADELGVDPSPETQALHLALLQADEDALIETLSSQGLVTLPGTLTSFVGRTHELDAVLDLISRERLVTLTGPGGVGKTRLAVEAARGAIASFADGVRFIDLAGATRATPLSEHVAAALGMAFPGGATTQAIGAALDTQRLLLIFDNCEHVLDTCAPFIRDLTANTSRPVILATSREALYVPGECAWQVPAFAVPDEDDSFEEISRNESAQLFCDRAGRVRPGFAFSAANAHAVGSICRRLDGLPLAIELAAARAGSMSVGEIADRMDERFALDEGGQGWHRTLRMAIDWSYDMLGSREAETFRLCGGFEGPFSVEDGNAIAGRELGAEIATLAQRSLLVSAIPESDALYRMLDPIRQYARERVTDDEDRERTIARYIDHYVVRTEGSDRSGDFTALVEQLSAFRADAMAAIDLALDRDRITDAVRLVAVLWKLWHARGSLMEGRAVLEKVLTEVRRLGEGAPSVLPIVLGLGTIAGNQSDFATAVTMLPEAADLAREAGDAASKASALSSLAFAYLATGRLDEFADCAAEAREAAEASRNDVAAGAIYQYLAGAAFMRADPDESQRYAQLSLDRFTRADHRSGMARALLLLTEIEGPHGIREDWLDLRQRALELARENGDRLTEAVVSGAIGNQLISDGRAEEGLPMLRQAMALLRRSGERRVLIKCFETVADMVAQAGDAARAVTLYSAIETLRSAVGMPLSDIDRVVVEGRLERARSAAGDRADRAAAEGTQMPFEELYGMAISSPVSASRDTAWVGPEMFAGER